MIGLESFAERSTETEIIDDMMLESGAMAEVLRDLSVINRYLGGYRTTLDALPALLPRGAASVRVLDVGAGGGDMARVLVDWGRSRGQRVEVVAVDLSQSAASYARDRVRDYPEITVVQADVLALPFEPESFDVVLCALFLHHFRQPDAVRLLRAMHDASRHGVIVNDLHRHPLAYAGIWALTRLFGASPIVCNDGPLSVRRAFDRRDFEDLARQTGLPLVVRWKWAFRFQVLIPKRGDRAVEHADV